MALATTAFERIIRTARVIHDGEEPFALAYGRGDTAAEHALTTTLRILANSPGVTEAQKQARVAELRRVFADDLAAYREQCRQACR